MSILVRKKLSELRKKVESTYQMLTELIEIVTEKSNEGFMA